MKYLYIGLALIVTVGAFCVINGRVMDAKMGEISSAIQQASEAYAAGKAAAALEDLRTAERLWNGCSDYLTSMLIHNNVDAAQQRIRVAKAALESGTDAADHIAAALESVRSLRESEKLLLGNIF